VEPRLAHGVPHLDDGADSLCAVRRLACTQFATLSRSTLLQGGPNHDNTTNFGDSSLLDVQADGSARLRFTPWYYVMGHVSRFARPGAHRVTASGAGFAASASDYDAVRAFTLGQSSNGSLPLVATAFVAPDGRSASVVVLNAGDAPLTFKLLDLASGPSGTDRAASASIPANSMQTYTWAL
jgi:hypothetical protein